MGGRLRPKRRGAVGARPTRSAARENREVHRERQFDEPFSFQTGELKIKDGKIHRIEALALKVPYGMPAGWSTK